jgi:hypothetical protein
MAPTSAARVEAAKTPIFAASWRAPGGKAGSETTSETVKPIPATDEVSDEAKAHLSFAHFEIINPYGTMVFDIAGVLKRSRRPLRRP